MKKSTAFFAAASRDSVDSLAVQKGSVYKLSPPIVCCKISVNKHTYGSSQVNHENHPIGSLEVIIMFCEIWLIRYQKKVNSNQTIKSN